MEGVNKFLDITWDDLTIVDDELKAVKDVDVQSLKYKDLRMICTQLKIRGAKSSTKEQMIKKLVSIRQIKSRYAKVPEAADVTDPATRKEPQCIYRLLNILFSDAFAEGFAQLGNVAARTELDGGKAANNQLFWEGVQEAFSGQDDAYDNLHFADDEVLEAVLDIDFKKIVPHDWKKLRALWKRLNAAYKAALSGFTMSGTHSSNFFEFCGGRHEIYYLRKHLEFRPDLVATVVADLPEEVFLESADKPASTISSVSKRKRDQDSVIVEALHELRTSRMEAELS